MISQKIPITEGSICCGDVFAELFIEGKGVWLMCIIDE